MFLGVVGMHATMIAVPGGAHPMSMTAVASAPQIAATPDRAFGDGMDISAQGDGPSSAGCSPAMG